jgi:hypothetical protein
MITPFGRAAGLGAVVLLCVGTFFVIARHPYTYQWDLSTYYHAVKAYEAGRNPYDRDVLSDIAGTAVRLKYVYPPHTLPFLQWLAILPYQTMHLVWLGIKAVFLIILLWIWMRLFPGSAGSPGFVLFSLLAFNGAVLSDLIAGNISILEQGFVWSGLLLLLHKHRMAFAVIIALAAFFKITYAFFLVLLLFPLTKESARALLLGALLVIAPLIASAMLMPDLFRNFLANTATVSDVLERGNNNPCLFAFILTLADLAEAGLGVKVPVAGAVSVFLLHALVVLYLAGRVVRNLQVSERKESWRDIVFLACLTYPLIVPRFKNYSFILLIPAAYDLFRRLGNGLLERGILMFVLVVPTFTIFSGLLPLTEYYLFFVSYAIFWWYLALLRHRVGNLESVSA